MRELAERLEGFHRIRLPLPFELNHVNTGLVQLPEGYLLIDTGMDTEDSFLILSESLASLGVEWNQIRLVLVTHMHPDHIGMLGRIRSLTGAKLMMHRAEVDHLNEMVDAGRPPWIDTGLELAGTPHSMRVAIHHTLSHLRETLRRVEADIPLEGGENIATAMGRAQIVWTPGHSVGHVCVYWPDRQILYSGDHMIEKITPNIGWLPDRDCLGEYLQSLANLIPFAIEIILPSHGDPFTGHKTWIDQTTAHHESRCAQIEGALRPGPATAHHLVPVLWDRHLSPFHYHFALFEVLAHLEHMSRSGRLHWAAAASGALSWSIAET